MHSCNLFFFPKIFVGNMRRPPRSRSSRVCCERLCQRCCKQVHPRGCHRCPAVDRGTFLQATSLHIFSGREKIIFPEVFFLLMFLLLPAVVLLLTKIVCCVQHVALFWGYGNVVICRHLPSTWHRRKGKKSPMPWKQLSQSIFEIGT